MKCRFAAKMSNCGGKRGRRDACGRRVGLRWSQRLLRDFSVRHQPLGCEQAACCHAVDPGDDGRCHASAGPDDRDRADARRDGHGDGYRHRPHHPSPCPHHPSPCPHHPSPCPHQPSPCPHHPSPCQAPFRPPLFRPLPRRSHRDRRQCRRRRLSRARVLPLRGRRSVEGADQAGPRRHIRMPLSSTADPSALPAVASGGDGQSTAGPAVSERSSAVAVTSRGGRSSSLRGLRVRSLPLVRSHRLVQLRFILDRAARVTFVLYGPAPRCVVAGRFSVGGHRGANVVRFGGRVRHELLPPGVYAIAPRLPGSSARVPGRTAVAVLVDALGARPTARRPHLDCGAAAATTGSPSECCRLRSLARWRGCCRLRSSAMWGASGSCSRGRPQRRLPSQAGQHRTSGRCFRRWELQGATGRLLRFSR